MKKANYFLMAVLFIFTSALFTSCEEDPDTPVGNGLEMEISETNSPDYLAGSTIDYSIKVTSNEKLKFFNVAVDGEWEFEGGAEGGKKLNNLKSTTIEYSFTIPENAESGEKFNLNFKVSDKKESKTQKVEVIVGASTTPLSGKKEGAIYHMLGSGNGAWNLVDDKKMMSADPDSGKDMVNTTTSSTPAGNYYFDKKWKSLNSTKFVKVSNFDYDNATVDAAEAAYNSGSKITKTDDVSKGDIFVANLRGEGNYAVIKVEDVVLTANTSSTTFDNNDAIKFSYKKQTTAKSGKKALMVYR